ncbi:MAG: hypothetical protein ACI89U_001021 [Gammaproteobacteria bacterium]|jgi:hypothetical protein
MSIRPFSPKTHEHIECYLPAYINGRLGSEHQRQIQKHINQCSDCFELLQKEQLIRQHLVDTPSELKWLMADQHTEQTLKDLLSILEIGVGSWRKRSCAAKRHIVSFVAELPLAPALCGIVFVLLVTVWLRP